jgi:hypothetical protein
METNLTAEESKRDLTLLNSIEQDPDISQATLADTLGVAVGTIKVKRMQRKKLRYILTAEGIALRANLTVKYIENSFSLYNLIRQRTRTVLDDLRSFGMDTVRIEGEGEVAEVCNLTCLEQGIQVDQDLACAVIKIDGLKLALRLLNETIVNSDQDATKEKHG